jgi:tetratricopeptide (TPR) repeat protein
MIESKINYNLMKASCLYFILFFVLFFTNRNLEAQTGVKDGSKYGHGQDSIRCLVNLTLSRDRVKTGNFIEALNYWRIAFNECPRSSQNLYVDGAKIYNYLIGIEKDPARKEALIDTLMIIYDRRMNYFDQKANILGRKGFDLLKYRATNISSVEEAYKYLEESINLMKNKSSMTVVDAFMASTIALYNSGRLSDINVIENYSMSSDIINFTLAENPADSTAKKVREKIHKNFISSGAPSCQSLAMYFKPNYQSEKNNVSFLRKLVSYMSDAGCYSDPIYIQASEALYRQEPSALAAFSLARLAVINENYSKAVAYYKEAIEKEQSPSNKAEYYYQLSWVTFEKLNDAPTARKYALQAINFRRGWGEPYMLIGDMYARAVDCFGDEFKKNTVYWAAVDKYNQAKSEDPSISEKADERIQIYSAYFPDAEALFFNGLKVGDQYKIGCWINEKTTVKAR